MKKKVTRGRTTKDADNLRPEYDFRGAARGVTAAKYVQGTNVVVIDPDLVDVFPDADSVNEALRALAGLLRRPRRSKRTSNGI